MHESPNECVTKTNNRHVIESKVGNAKDRIVRICVKWRKKGESDKRLKRTLFEVEE